MNPKNYALFGGIVMIAAGTLAFLPQLSQLPSEAGLPVLNLEISYGLFLGLFPMNALNKLAMIAIGAMGVMASQAGTTALPRSIQWSRWSAGTLASLAFLGLIPQTNTLGGYWPLFGAEVGLHAFFAVLGAYFGFTLTQKAARRMEPLKTDHPSSRVA